MRKTTKIIICALSVLVALTCVVVGFVATRGSDDKETTTNAAPEVVNPVTTQKAEAEDTTTSKSEATLAELIIGKWTDSAGMSGFEFFEGGKVSFTYANLAALGINFDGKVENGTYKLEGNKLTIAYSIYTATIDKEYEISIDSDTLKMKNIEDNKTSTYVRGEAKGGENETTTTTATASSTSDELYGSWENKSMSKKYKFSGLGKVTIVLDDESFEGVYVSEGNTVTIQYTAYSKKITEKYTFSVTTNALSLTNEAGSEFIFVRTGTSAVSTDDKELLGKWRDSANMSGYEFKENGVVAITFVNIDIPVINVPVNGTFTGGYEIKNGVLTLTYYIYGNTISESFTYEVSGNSLQLKKVDDGKISTYMKQ